MCDAVIKHAWMCKHVQVFTHMCVDVCVQYVCACSDLLWHYRLRGAANGRHPLAVQRLVRFIISVSPALIRRVVVVAGQPAVHAQVVGAHRREIGHAVVVEIEIRLSPVQLKETHDGSCVQRGAKNETNTKTKKERKL